jgi:hypothetical protein
MLVPALFVMLLTGCNSASHATSSPDAAAEDGATATFGASTCGQCVTQACSMQVSACNSDPDCSAYLSCLDACGVGADGNVDATCAAACPKGNSSAGMSAESQLTDCRTSGPGATMCSACGADAGPGNPILDQQCMQMMDVTPCYTCEDDYCCNTYANCHANPDCDSLERCLKDCVDDVADDAGSPQGGPPDGGSCDLVCAHAHPQGLIDWAPRITCLTVYCGVQCENPPMPPLPPCEACVNKYCALEFANLNGTPDGFLYGACVAACPSGANPCNEACSTQYPSVQAANDALLACAMQNCPSCETSGDD